MALISVICSTASGHGGAPGHRPRRAADAMVRASPDGSGSAAGLEQAPSRLGDRSFRLTSPLPPSGGACFPLLLPRHSAALGLLAGLALAAPAAAHQPLVGNFGQGVGLVVDHGASDVAQGFTTGGNPTGYHFLGVHLRILDLAAGTTAKLSTGLPDSIAEVATLTAAATPDSGGDDVCFSAPADTQLAADTTYWVVIRGSSGGMRGTSSRAEETGSAAGWSIADNRLVRTGGTTGPFSAASGPYAGPLRMRVYGHVNSATATSDEFPVRSATGNKPAKPIGSSALPDGNGRPASSRSAPGVDAAHAASQGYRPGRGTDGGADSDTLIRSARMTP